MVKGSLILYSCLLFLTALSSARAAPATLSEQAETYIHQKLSHLRMPGTQLSIKLRQTNTRLKLKSCAAPIQFSSNRPLQTGSVSLKASCDYPRHWSQYIRAEVKLLRQVLVSSRSLNKGHSLTRNDLRFALLDQHSLRNGFLNTPEQVIGQELNRTLSSDRPITAKMLISPLLINQGDGVTIQAGNNGITVEMSGTALESGRLGEQIQIKNNRSGRTIKARITGRGIAKALR